MISILHMILDMSCTGEERLCNVAFNRDREYDSPEISSETMLLLHLQFNQIEGSHSKVYSVMPLYCLSYNIFFIFLLSVIGFSRKHSYRAGKNLKFDDEIARACI